jgi:hypothetical protein
MVGCSFDYYFPAMRGSTAGWWVTVTLAIGACGGRSLDPSTGRVSIQDAGAGPDARDVVDALPSADGLSTSVDGPVTRIAPTRVLTAGPVDAVTIAADDSGVFGMTRDNAVWALPTGGDALQILAQDPGTRFPSCSESGRMITAGNDLFWVARRALPDHHWTTVLHRTSKDGTRDEVVADDLLIDGFVTLAADDTFVYWNEIADLYNGGGSVRAFFRNAPAGTPPLTVATVSTWMEIASVTVDERSLYWTPFRAIGTTVPWGELWTGDKRALAAGDSTSARKLSDVLANAVGTHDDELFLTYSGGFGDGWSSWFAHLSKEGAMTQLAHLQEAAADSIVFVDRWAILSLSSGGCGDGTRRLVAVPTSAGSGTMTTIAEGAVTPVALGAEGITFVNADGALVAISKADLNLALTGSP